VFDKLHHAFFVGDILIKRDCRALQDLAPNVCIVNMYGTTETQRAVSYFEIPSYASDRDYLAGMKDVIPAGKGMFNVQLLVVNRHDPTKLCAVGEVGEIYVRAGGLAEGYLETPELTEKKFVKNCLWILSSGSKNTKPRRRRLQAMSHGRNSTFDLVIDCIEAAISDATRQLAMSNVQVGRMIK
jgi:non-ribosomal peptide synthetase component F